MVPGTTRYSPNLAAILPPIDSYPEQRRRNNFFFFFRRSQLFSASPSQKPSFAFGLFRDPHSYSSSLLLFVRRPFSFALLNRLRIIEGLVSDIFSSLDPFGACFFGASPLCQNPLCRAPQPRRFLHKRPTIFTPSSLPADIFLFNSPSPLLNPRVEFATPIGKDDERFERQGSCQGEPGWRRRACAALGANQGSLQQSCDQGP